MANPTPKERAEHILKAIQNIREFICGVSEKKFLKETLIQSAVQYEFLIIGEAIRYIDNSILEKYSYPWHIPRSFRNFIIHVYHNIRMERLYFATQDLDDLEEQIKLILEQEFN